MKTITNEKGIHRELNNRLFYIAIAIFYFAGIINETVFIEYPSISFLITVMNWTVRILLLIKILFQKAYLRKDLLRIAVFVLTLLLSYYLSRYNELIWIALFILSAQDIDIDKSVKITMTVTAVTILGIILLSAFGVISNETVYSTNIYSGLNSQVKLYGFNHHNFIGCRILMTYMCYVYLHFDEFNVKDYAIGIAASGVLYTIFKSRTSAVLLAVCVFLLLIIRMLEHFEKKQGRALVKVGIYSMMVFSIVFSCIVTVGYQKGNALCALINTVIYKRFSYASQCLNEYGISIFGQKIELISSISAEELGVNALILDNAYMLMMVQCGIVFFLIVMYGYFLVVKKSIGENNYKVAAIIAIYFICGISEKWLFTVSYNPFIILASVALYCKNHYMVEVMPKA